MPDELLTITNVPASADGPVVVRLSGELDISSVDLVVSALVEAVQSAAAPGVVVDLAGLSFCAVVGLRAFVIAHREGADRQVPVRFRGPARPVARALAVSGLDALLVVEA